MSNLKSYSDTYLYSKYPVYSKLLTDAIMHDPVIDKGTDSFQDVIFEIKRTRASESILRVLQSKNIILLDCVKPLPRSFKVFYAKDVKGDKTGKVFIDCTGVIDSELKGGYSVDQLKLLSYLINAAVTTIYYKKPDALNTYKLLEYSTEAFSKCFTYIIDYLAKISIQESSKIRVQYLSALYFMVGVLNMDYDNRARDIAKKIAGISDREATMLELLLEKTTTDNYKEKKISVQPFENIKVFVRAIKEVMHLEKITVDIVVEKWMFLFGPSTVFGLEFFPAFSAMLTDTYVGAYLNNQKQIEKVAGKVMVTYTKTVLEKLNSLA